MRWFHVRPDIGSGPFLGSPRPADRGQAGAEGVADAIDARGGRASRELVDLGPDASIVALQEDRSFYHLSIATTPSSLAAELL